MRQWTRACVSPAYKEWHRNVDLQLFHMRPRLGGSHNSADISVGTSIGQENDATRTNYLHASSKAALRCTVVGSDEDGRFTSPRGAWNRRSETFPPDAY